MGRPNGKDVSSLSCKFSNFMLMLWCLQSECGLHKNYFAQRAAFVKKQREKEMLEKDVAKE